MTPKITPYKMRCLVFTETFTVNNKNTTLIAFVGMVEQKPSFFFIHKKKHDIFYIPQSVREGMAIIDGDNIAFEFMDKRGYYIRYDGINRFYDKLKFEQEFNNRLMFGREYAMKYIDSLNPKYKSLWKQFVTTILNQF